MEFLNLFYFYGPFLALLDPDSESGYRSNDPIESGSETLIQVHISAKERLENDAKKMKYL
jgi:hypothetical protein